MSLASRGHSRTIQGPSPARSAHWPCGHRLEVLVRLIVSAAGDIQLHVRLCANLVCRVHSNGRQVLKPVCNARAAPFKQKAVPPYVFNARKARIKMGRLQNTAVRTAALGQAPLQAAAVQALALSSSLKRKVGLQLPALGPAKANAGPSMRPLVCCQTARTAVSTTRTAIAVG